MGMRVGIFGGSFDPVHNEHIRLVQEAFKSLCLDELIIVPAGTPPHKRHKDRASAEHRLKLCTLAFSAMERVRVSDYEIKNGGMSYTYLTCRHFKQAYKDAELFWLVGTDMLRDFPTWKNPTDILSNVTLAVCARDEKSDWLAQEQSAFFDKFGCHFAVVDYNGKPVSSTKIRVLAGAGMEIPQVPKQVADYIDKHKLYAIPNADKALSLLSAKRKEHSLRVAVISAERANAIGVSERKAITASLFHDCAKNVQLSSPLLQEFTLRDEWGSVPEAVLHQFTGAYIAEQVFGVTDEEVLDAIRYHTSGKENMSELGKLIFLADMIEEERKFDGVETLRKLFYKPSKSSEKGAGALDDFLREALRQTIAFLEKKGADMYPLTLQAYEFYRRYNYGNDE